MEQEELSALTSDTYISFYGGEPLLNMPFIKQVVDYIETMSVNRNFVYSMTTNAMLLDRYMDYLAEKRFRLLISLDGDREAQGYRITKSGENSFDTVYANVRELQQKYPDYFQESVNFNSVLHSKNSVEGTFRFIKDTFGKEPTISELNNSEVKEERREEYDRIYKNKHESIRSSEDYGKFSKELFLGEPETNDLLIFLHQYSGTVFRDYNFLFIDEKDIKTTPTGTCTPFSRKMFITVNGKILQCERIDHAFTYGHITEEKVELDLEEVATTFNSYLTKMKNRCELCYRKHSCIQCLYYIPDIQEEKPQCIGFMDKKGYNDYVSYCLYHLKTHPQLYKKLMTEVKVE